MVGHDGHRGALEAPEQAGVLCFDDVRLPGGEKHIQGHGCGFMGIEDATQAVGTEIRAAVFLPIDRKLDHVIRQQMDIRRAGVGCALPKRDEFLEVAVFNESGVLPCFDGCQHRAGFGFGVIGVVGHIAVIQDDPASVEAIAAGQCPAVDAPDEFQVFVQIVEPLAAAHQGLGDGIRGVGIKMILIRRPPDSRDVVFIFVPGRAASHEQGGTPEMSRMLRSLQPARIGEELRPILIVGGVRGVIDVAAHHAARWCAETHTDEPVHIREVDAVFVRMWIELHPVFMGEILQQVQAAGAVRRVEKQSRIESRTARHLESPDAFEEVPIALKAPFDAILLCQLGEGKNRISPVQIGGFGSAERGEVRSVRHGWFFAVDGDGVLHRRGMGCDDGEKEGDDLAESGIAHVPFHVAGRHRLHGE